MEPVLFADDKPDAKQAMMQFQVCQVRRVKLATRCTTSLQTVLNWRKRIGVRDVRARCRKTSQRAGSRRQAPG
jgi:hypothetical protein